MISRFRLLFAACPLLFFPLLLSAQTITTQPLGQSTFCIGSEISVDFTVAGAFNPGNAMILQLSDPNGSFTSSFRNLGSVSTTVSGTIVTKITTDIPSGGSYRFRVIGSNPRVDGSDNGTDLTFERPPEIRIGLGPEPVLQGRPFQLKNSTVGATSYWWKLDLSPGASISQTDEAQPWVTYSTPGVKEIKFWAGSPSGCVQTGSMKVNVIALNPVIPANAIIVRKDTVINYESTYDPIWVCPGGICRLRTSGRVIYIEGGGSVIAGGSHGNLVYAKSAASWIGNGEKEGNMLFIHEDGASLIGEDLKPIKGIEVPSLTFDYSNIPPGGCPSLAPYTVQIKPNTNSIHSAQNDNRSDAEYWVRDGGALTSTGEGNAYYVEAGGHVVVEGSHNRVYVKNGATVDVQSGSENRIFYELQGTIVNSGADAILLPSSAITFESEVSGVAEESVTAGGDLIAVSPNPAGEIAEVRVDPALGRVRWVRVYTMLGEEVEMFSATGPTLRLSLAGYAAGQYYVKIETEKGLYVRKLMKR